VRVFAGGPCALPLAFRELNLLTVDPKVNTWMRGVTMRELQRRAAQARRAAGLQKDVNILIADGAQMRRLNRRFRGKNHSTDVLSFPPAARLASDCAGDLAISATHAKRQAHYYGHPLAAELQILMLHGMLHLAGYDHERDHGQMARREERLRRKLSLPVALIRRTGEALDPKPGERR